MGGGSEDTDEPYHGESMYSIASVPYAYLFLLYSCGRHGKSVVTSLSGKAVRAVMPVGRCDGPVVGAGYASFFVLMSKSVCKPTTHQIE